MLKRIKRITSHTGYARFLAECDGVIDDCADVVGVIERQMDIPSPYRYSPEWSVYCCGGRFVTIVETAHRQYDVFLVPEAMIRQAMAA